jgi:hypothetical protein
VIKPGDFRRFWFPAGGHFGIGVTAVDLADATNLATTAATQLRWTIDVAGVIEDIDVRDLEQNHVAPNMGVVVFRGVWYPLMGPLK